MSSASNISEPSTSTTSTPPPESQTSNTSYLSYPVSHVVSSLYRRLTDNAPRNLSPNARSHQLNPQPPAPLNMSGVYTPPHRTASPFQPPPLTPLNLAGINPNTSPSAIILSRTLAEEIRLLVPPRLQLQDTWSLTYSVEQDGTSLGTLYNKCSSPDLPKSSSFVLVVRDAAGGIFGAYLTSAPHPSPSYYGTGECFLWRSSLLPSSSILSSLPPPPSAPTDPSLGRSTTIASPTNTSFQKPHAKNNHNLQPPSSSNTSAAPSRSATPDPLIRFKAFPYSGVNDYLIFCEPSYLSVGGGDGRYGLWLDGVLERGVSSPCMTFGNEGLSEEGEKFEVLGVEVWWVGG